MKVIAFGSRSWNDKFLVRAWAIDLGTAEVFHKGALASSVTVVHGASSGGGADYWIDRYARQSGFTVIPVPVGEEDYKLARTRRQAPIMRNLRMFDQHPDVRYAVGFWDGTSPGSKHMVEEARRRNITVELHHPDGSVELIPDQ